MLEMGRGLLMEKMREGLDSHGRRRKMREGPPSPAAAELATRAGMWEGGDGGKPTGSRAHGRWQGIVHGRWDPYIC